MRTLRIRSDNNYYSWGRDGGAGSPLFNAESQRHRDAEKTGSEFLSFLLREDTIMPGHFYVLSVPLRLRVSALKN